MNQQVIAHDFPTTEEFEGKTKVERESRDKSKSRTLQGRIVESRGEEGKVRWELFGRWQASEWSHHLVFFYMVSHGSASRD